MILKFYFFFSSAFFKLAFKPFFESKANREATNITTTEKFWLNISTIWSTETYSFFESSIVYQFIEKGEDAVSLSQLPVMILGSV